MSKTQEALIPDSYWQADGNARELTAHKVNGLNEALRIFVIDEPGAGGACHEYIVCVPAPANNDPIKGSPFEAFQDAMAFAQSKPKVLQLADGHSVLTYLQHPGIAIIEEQKGLQPTLYHVQRISFQNGPVKEAGYNGNSQEALLAILIDRLEGFQSGNYKCHDNQVALDHLQGARLWLHKRTMDRLARGVEGTHQK